MKYTRMVACLFSVLVYSVNAAVINIAMHHNDPTVAAFDTEADGGIVSAGSNGSDTWNNVSRNGGDTLSFTGKMKKRLEFHPVAEKMNAL